jgi:hypothetical protein
MKVFRTLEIRMSESQVDGFIDKVESVLNCGWKLDKKVDYEEAILPNTRLFYFLCNKNDKREPAFLALAWDVSPTSHDKNLLYVANIVPREKQSLSVDEYNYILKEFYDKFVKPIIKELKIQAALSPDQQTLEDWISDESANRLRRFSSLANKSTGSAHHYDRERWFAFIVSVFRNNEQLDTWRLRRVLIEEEGWAPDIAAELAIEYEQGIELLRYYRNH